jgi:hypothetical protein
MDELNTENQDALNLESDQDTTLENESGDDGEKLAKANEYARNQKIRAEKAEAELKKFKSQPKPETETPKNEESKSNEPDYTKKLVVKTYLKSEGIEHPDDQNLILDEAKRLKMEDNLDELVKMDYIQSKLKANKEKRDVADAMPSGKGKSGSDFKSDVDYWVERRNPDGTYQTPEDTELAGKVIEARVRKEKSGSQFEPIRF